MNFKEGDIDQCRLLFLWGVLETRHGVSLQEQILTCQNPHFSLHFTLMKQKTITIQTTKLFDVSDLTDQVSEFLKSINAQDGLVNIFTQHTTTAIKINEKEDGFFADMNGVLFTDIAPINRAWNHNDAEERDPATMCGTDGCLNGHSHVAQMLVGATSETIPVVKGSMQLGTWQRILFFEMDRPRERKVVISFLGE